MLMTLTCLDAKACPSIILMDIVPDKETVKFELAIVWLSKFNFISFGLLLYHIEHNFEGGIVWQNLTNEACQKV